MQYKNPGILKFKAELIGTPESPEGGYVYFPFSVEELFGVKGRVPIKATFNGIPYTGSMVKYGSSKHMILMLKSIRKQINKNIGDLIDVTVELDATERKIDLPKDVEIELNKYPNLLSYYNSLSYTHKKEYITWIEEAKKPETRVSRINKMLKMLEEKA